MLWSQEMEAARPKLREESAAFLKMFPREQPDPSLPPDARVKQLREADFTARGDMDLTSKRAVDREIDGPAGKLRLHVIEPTDGRIDAVMLHIHGGGFMIGKPEMMDLLNEVIADGSHVATVSVDYRLAPEDPYPAGPDDCEAAAVWLLEHAEAEWGTPKLVIGGESAGGHLSAATLLRMRDKHQAADRFLGANLMFGIYDLSGLPSHAGVGIRPDCDMLTTAGMHFFNECFTPGMTADERRDPGVSPLWAELTGLCPALITVGTDDHLLDDSLLMAQRWQVAGNRAELLVYPDTPHGCMACPTVAADYFPRLQTFLTECIAAG